MLEGQLVNLRVVEKEHLPLIAGWRNNPEFQGEYNLLIQESRRDLERRHENFPPAENWFLIEKKDKTKVGLLVLEPLEATQEIGYNILPSERGKGYCTEAVKIIVDYLFLSQNITRIQAHTNIKNTASQRVLEKAGFMKEALVRSRILVRGQWRDEFLYSIIREEWRTPKILIRQYQPDENSTLTKLTG